eukprot:Amastigsp_a345041_84.p1 type:complete len:153 gc:universal Amastigsp_a345041_84:1-459(+)
MGCISGSVPRVEGYLAVTRALHSAANLADAVTWRPAVTVTRLAGDELLVLATDGVWDRVSDRSASMIAFGTFSQLQHQACSSGLPPLQTSTRTADACRGAARDLVDFAFQQRSGDNISVLCVSPRVVAALPSPALTSESDLSSRSWPDAPSR